MLRHLAVKFDFLHLGNISPPPPFPPKKMFMPCWRDPIRSKQLSRVAIVGFQFGLYHVVVPLSFLRSISLASFSRSLPVKISLYLTSIQKKKNNKSKWHTRTPTHGLASTLRMRTAISPGQRQPWTRPFNTALDHYRWPYNDVTATCTYHFDNGIVLSTSNFISTDGFSAFTLLLGGFPTVSHWWTFYMEKLINSSYF